ncbi:MAG: hypothetical protein ACKVQK_16905 [Burkholderiales bacterium]
MSRKAYTSAIKRLETLPEIFTGGDLTTLCRWSSPIASTYLANWRKAGLVKSLGGRSDVFMNVFRNRHVNPEAALRRAFPAATKVGADVLREAGWTTQILSLPEVAVPQPGPIYSVEEFTLTGRPNKWFAKVAPGVQQVEDGLMRLKPAWALVDMVARALDRRVRHAWLLAPDDLDLVKARDDKALSEALAALGVDEQYLTDAGYARIHEQNAAINS